MSADHQVLHSPLVDDSDDECQSVILGGEQKLDVVKKGKGGKVSMRLVVKAPTRVQQGQTITIQIEIENNTNKSIKEIDAQLVAVNLDDEDYVKKSKKKRTPKEEQQDYRKIPRTTIGTVQQYFQGARFPLPASTGYTGEITYPIPTAYKTSDFVAHELVITLPYKKKLLVAKLTARVPLVIS
eukprot:TRINITY_DN15897_c0_g1_i1.p1 TRINITY_DN15897_c0_g1~~TRINITY_DN15897_c0_g1_i1.p1  ORF type:complete len:183 (-),score=44.01 TRINITY_DN15897_c0_g1_i1:87-635(-)